MKLHFPLANLAVVTAFVFGAAFTFRTASAQEDGRTYAQTDLGRAATELLRGEKDRRALKKQRERDDAELADPGRSARERRAIRERRAQDDADLVNPQLTERERRDIRQRRAQEDADLAEQRQNARDRYIEQQREAQLEQAERDRRRQRRHVDPTAPAGRDPDDQRYAPGGKP